MQHGLNALALLHLQDVDNIGTLGSLTALRDLISLLAVHLAGVGKEEDIVVGRGGKHIHHVVLVTGGDALLAHTALGLSGILADRRALDIACLGQGENTFLFLNKILNVDLIHHILNLSHTVVTVLITDGSKLFL